MRQKNYKDNSLDNPHDKLMFSALRNHDIARDAMNAILPSDLLAELNLKNIKLYNTKLVSPQMKEFQADIIYEVPFKDSQLLLLFHCEHESKPRRVMPLKVWQYLFLVLMEYLENHPGESLPLPYPVIVYTGEERFNHSTYLFDMFGENKQKAESLFYQDIKLIDVCKLKDDDIKKHQLFGLCEFAFKYKATKDFSTFLDTILPWLHKVEYQIGPDYAKILIKYVADAFNNGDVSLLIEKSKLQLSKQLGDEVMTIAQQLRQQGMQQGMQREKYVIAEKLLAKGLDAQFISEATELNREEIEKLKQLTKN